MPHEPRPLRILLATLAALDRPGGVPRSVELLSTGLRERGHDVTVLSCPIAAGVRRTVARRVWRRLSPSTEEAHRIDLARRRMADAPELAQGHDVAVAFEAWSAGVCAGAGMPSVLRVAGLGSITDEWLRNGFVARGSRAVARLRGWEQDGTERAAHVVVLGGSSADAMRALGVPDGRLTVIHNAVEAPPGDPEPRDPGPLRVVAVGNLRAVKGADVLAEALARLPADLRARVELVHAGEGADDGNPTFVAARDALRAGGVRHAFRGAIAHDDVWALLRSADVFAFPSRVESFGNALVEAIAVGAPVVATDVGAVREILGDDAHAAGLIVQPADAGALAAALGSLLSSPEQRAAWGTRNAARARARFSLPGMLDAYERVLRAAAAV